MFNHGDSTIGGADFRTTHWSLIRAVGQSDSTVARNALDKLYRTYSEPVYGFLRKCRHDPEKARDLTQEFFLQLIEEQVLAQADRNRGKFRAFLTGCLRNFERHDRRKQNTIKRGGQFVFVPLDLALVEERYAADTMDGKTPEKLFEYRLALILLEQAMSNLQKAYAAPAQARRFQTLHAVLTEDPDAPRSYAEAAAQLGITENNARQAALQLRKKFYFILRGLIAETLGAGASTEEIDAELKHFFEILSG